MGFELPLPSDPLPKDVLMPTLFDPVEMGALALPNRIIMAPLTRGRADKAAVPTGLMAEYYAQRAAAGLIISEATGISREGLGWPYAPGLWSDEQVEGWKPVVAAVHAAGGRIVAQLWHMGRLVHDSVSGTAPVSASATRGPHKAHTYDGKQILPEARAATADDIARILGDYAAAARNAVAAGFDGVQIHAANGYLIDQFLRDGTNVRDDGYGGPIENRLRFVREVVEAVAAEVGIARTGIRLSPIGESQGANDRDNAALFTAAASALEALGVPYFDGFVGALRARFRTELVEAVPAEADRWLPAFLLRVWKLHGSVNWAWEGGERAEVVRLGSAVTDDQPAAIHPSDAKYDESRRVPFVVLQDRLRRALNHPETLMLVSGYSFSDAHLNEMLFDAARRRPRSEVIAFCFSSIPDQLAYRATTTPNLQAVGAKEAIIGGLRADWETPDDAPDDLWANDALALVDFANLAGFLARSSPPQGELEARLGELLAKAAANAGA